MTYATHDGVDLQGDLYLPAGPGPFPVIVNVHGGYWRRGSRDTFHHWGPYLAERGYAGFTISYRLTKPGKKTYPQVVYDVRAAVQFMRGEAKKFRLDPKRIALWGNSAGAHLAALVALAGDDPLFAGGYPDDPHADVSTKVKVLIGVYGIYELMAQWRQSQIGNPGDNLVESLLGVSPVRIAASISRPRRSAMPPRPTTRPQSIWPGAPKTTLSTRAPNRTSSYWRSSRRDSLRGPASCMARRITG